MTDQRMRPLNDAQRADFRRAVEEAMGGPSGVQRATYAASRDPQIRLGVMRAPGVPEPDTQAAVSVGLANHVWAHANFPDRLELLHVWDGLATDNERLVVVAAETMIITGKPAKPGAVYLDAVKAADLPVASRMPHALITFPYLRGWPLQQVTTGGARIWLLQVTPIFEQEKQFIEKHGFAKFQELLSYDVMDLHRMNRASHVV
ncbi:suppressor of fused domain protein [Leptolyngbya sp. 15MV]|nr:suppressor of fused domain protein [Leptolyngbya sp. 15MV]